MKRLYSKNTDSSVSLNQCSMYRDQGFHRNPERLRGDKSILNGIALFTRGPRKCRALLISACSFRNLTAASVLAACIGDADGVCQHDISRIWNVVRVLQDEVKGSFCNFFVVVDSFL